MSETIVKLTPSDLAALMCARICHDLVSPIGALSTALEVLDDESNADMHEDAMNLVRLSAGQASDKLKFLRMAFGASTSAPGVIAMAEVRDLIDEMYKGGKANFHWNLNDLKSAVYIEGTINNPEDTDSYWTVEMAIPLQPFVGLKNRPKTLPKEGEQWKLNFSRVEWDFDITDGQYQRKKENNKHLKEYNWVWSNQKVINMHEPEKWGVLQFTEEVSNKGIIYKEDEDLHIKQIAFALYRKTNFQDLKTYLNFETGTTKSLKVKYSESDSLTAQFYKTNFGFEYVIKSNTSNKTYIINEQGKLKTL